MPDAQSLPPRIASARKARLRCMVLLAGLSLATLLSPAQQPLDRSFTYPVRKIYRSALFQGHHRRAHYFEGWYFKQVSPDGKAIFALIPGIALDREGRGHAFIQLIDGTTGQTYYHSFPPDSFHYSRKDFAVRIAGNRFSLRGLQVDIGEGEERFTADLSFRDPRTLKSRLLSPGIMGWYRYAPFMETYHGLLSMDHEVNGRVGFGGKAIDFSGGRGYIEKDWGSSFPSSYIWMQSNHFGRESTSFMCSIARVPWLGRAFPGFLGFLLLDGELYRFATYTGARLEDLRVDESGVQFSVVEKDWRIEVRASRARTGLLKAPVAGSMDRRIAESVDAVLHIRLLDRGGGLLYQGSGRHAGLEVAGRLEELVED